MFASAKVPAVMPGCCYAVAKVCLVIAGALQGSGSQTFLELYSPDPFPQKAYDVIVKPYLRFKSWTG